MKKFTPSETHIAFIDMSSKMYNYRATAFYMHNLSHRTLCTMLKSVSYLLTLMTKFECRLRKKLPHTLQLTDRLKVAPKCLLQSFSALRLFGVPTLYIRGARSIKDHIG